MSRVRHGDRGPTLLVDDTLRRLPQLRDAMVGHVQLAPGCRAANGMTALSAVPMAVINIFNISRPLVPGARGTSSWFRKGRYRMLGSVAIWFALTRDKRGLQTVGVLFLLVILATLVWNLVP